jgi:anti-anti-sigma factor
MSEIQFNFNKNISDIELSGQFLQNNVAIIQFSGVLDTYNSNDVTNELIQFIQNNSLDHLILDFEKLSYASSTGIGAITEVYKAAKKKDNAEVYLKSVDDSVKKVFDLLGFSSLFSYIEKIDDIQTVKKSIFPKAVSCPSCSKQLKAMKSGAFKCPSCKHIFRINSEGEIVENR